MTFTFFGPSFCILLAMPSAETSPGEEARAWGRERYRWIRETFESTADDSVLDRRRASRRISRERGAAEKALVDVLGHTDADDVKSLIIELLAEMRSERAVWPLIREIRLKHPWGPTRWQVPMDECTAARALIAIGQRSVREILENRTRMPATDDELKLFAGVVYGHYLFDSAVGRFHIQRVLDDVSAQARGEGKRKVSPDALATRQQNLTRLLEHYEAIDRGELFPAFGGGR